MPWRALLFTLVLLLLRVQGLSPAPSSTVTTDLHDTDTTTTPTAETSEDGVTTNSSSSPTKSATVQRSKSERQALLSSLQCGKRSIRSGRIVGGEDSYEGEFPWTVSVRLLTTHLCGGTIINKRWILTAAHCVKRYRARYFRIRMGEQDVNVEHSRPDIDVLVDDVVVHPNFNYPRRYSNDVAALKLKWPLSFSPIALPVCLPDDVGIQGDLIGRNATVVGWGWLNEVDKGKSKAKRLQKVQVPVLNNSVCEKWYTEEYKDYVRIDDYQICAGYKEGGKDSCQGDSGGPLVIKEGGRYTIIGIVSAGMGCARKHLPGIYSRVSAFLPWIRNVTSV